MAKRKKEETPAIVEKPSKAALDANKELSEILGGLENYYSAKNKAELQEFVDDSIEQIQEFAKYPNLKHYVEDSEKYAEEFDATKEKEMNNLLYCTGVIVSNLRSCLLEFNAKS